MIWKRIMTIMESRKGDDCGLRKVNENFEFLSATVKTDLVPVHVVAVGKHANMIFNFFIVK